MIVNDYFLIAPDWQYGIISGRRWTTTIQTSLTRGEKRSRLVDYPTKILRYTIVPFTANENSYVRRKLYRARNKKFGVPIWCDQCITTQQVSPASGLTFTVGENSNRQYEVGGLLILYEDQDNYEIKEIDAIGSNQFTVVDAFVGTWPSGTEVYPIIQGILTRSISLPQYTTQGHAEILIEVVEEFDEDVTRTVYSGNTFPTYVTYPVFNVEPNYASSPESTIEVYPSLLKFLAKSVDYAYSVEGSIAIKTHNTFYTRADAYEVVKLFDECMGRWGEFWLPSWQDDVVLTDTFLNTDTVLEVEDIEWSDYWKHNKTIGRFLYVLLPNGTEIIRKILSAPSSTQLQVDTAMGTTITSLQNVISCFLYMVRFSIDELSLEWKNQVISEADISFITINDAVTITTTTT